MNERSNELNGNVKKWVEALRSGEFKQCTGQLRRGGRYCALGVANVIAQRNGVDLPVAAWLGVGLPIVVADWLGANSGMITIPLGNMTVVSMNDVWEYTFPEIAEMIESHPEAFTEPRYTVAPVEEPEPEAEQERELVEA